MFTDFFSLKKLKAFFKQETEGSSDSLHFEQLVC